MVPKHPRQAYVEHMQEHTVRVVCNAESFESQGSIGSGILLQRPARIVLVTAGHNFDRPGTWSLETTVHVGKKTLLVPIPNPQRLASFNLATGEVQKLDIAWSWLDTEQPGAPREIELNVYRGPIDTNPTVDDRYGFAAGNQVVLDANLSELDVTIAYELGMEFRGTDDRGLHVFALARPHQGHSYYYGASGAPIADETGLIVSILVSGDPEQDLLFGSPLATVAGLIDGIGPPSFPR